MNEWLYVGLFFIVGLIIPVGAIGVAWILGPKEAQSHQTDNLRMRHRNSGRQLGAVQGSVLHFCSGLPGL